MRVFTAYRDGAYSFLLHRPKQRYKISMIEKKLGPKKINPKITMPYLSWLGINHYDEGPACRDEDLEEL